MGSLTTQVHFKDHVVT